MPPMRICHPHAPVLAIRLSQLYQPYRLYQLYQTMSVRNGTAAVGAMGAGFAFRRTLAQSAPSGIERRDFHEWCRKPSALADQ